MPTRTRPEQCCQSPGRLSPLPSAESRRWIALFKALANPTRLEILRLVAAQDGPSCECDIVDRFSLSQPTISHHLGVLVKAGLLEHSRAGIWSFYAVDPAGTALLERAPELASSGAG